MVSSNGRRNKRESLVHPNVTFQIAQLSNANTLGLLSGINTTSRNITKAEYDRRMPKTPLKHTKEQLVDVIWRIFTNVYEGEDIASTHWPEDVYEYFVAIGTFPHYNVNKRPHNAVYKFNSKRGYFEFMKRLSKEKVFGLYIWLSKSYLRN